jgi:hypothetical protein
VLQTALNDFYVTYELNAYTDAPEIMSPHYTQIRDGNHTTIPADYLPPDYQAPAMRITMEDEEEKGKK